MYSPYHKGSRDEQSDRHSHRKHRHIQKWFIVYIERDTTDGSAALYSREATCRIRYYRIGVASCRRTTEQHDHAMKQASSEAARKRTSSGFKCAKASRSFLLRYHVWHSGTCCGHHACFPQTRLVVGHKRNIS